MTIGSVWEALAGRAPGQPLGPAEPGLWASVVERLNPARAKPVLRQGIEEAHLISVRGMPYTMIKSPDLKACYLRLSPEELQLARVMDGSLTVARLVAEFAKITGQLAPDRVVRLVANLAANRMLEELPVNAFRPLDKVRQRPWPVRLGRGLLAAAQGKRLVLANVDGILGLLYRAGGRLLFTRPAALLLSLVAIAGLAIFGVVWLRGDQSIFLTGGSYATGAAVLLGFNVVALACHELGHGLAAKHAGRRVPAAGFLVYFGIPSVFVDTTDVWMAGRRARLITTISGPAAGLVLAGAAQVLGLIFPELSPWTFKLSFAWYLNVLFNLNPFLALDGYYLVMDWLEIPNLRARGLAWIIARLRRRPPRWPQLDREGRLVALYGALAMVWLVIAANLVYRIYADRVSGLVTGLWRSGWPARLLLVAIIAGLMAPVVHALLGWCGRLIRRLRERRRAAGTPHRLAALRASTLAKLPEAQLNSLAGLASWLYPRNGEQLSLNGKAVVVVTGFVEGRKPGDPAGAVRERVGPGGVVIERGLVWRTAGTSLLSIPAAGLAGLIEPDQAELEDLVPGLSTGQLSSAHSESIAPGGQVAFGSDEAIVIVSGVIVCPDGTELRRGIHLDFLTGATPETPGGLARTAVRLWRVPVTAGLALAVAGFSPSAGVHPQAEYPPLLAPPVLSQVDGDDSADQKFERRLRRTLAVLLLLALLLTGSNLVSGAAWAEMPADRALLTVEHGTAIARGLALDRGDDLYVGDTDQIAVGPDSWARLTFHGGSSMLLCARSSLTVGPLSTTSGRPSVPAAAAALTEGQVIAETSSPSVSFAPLALSLANHSRPVVNDGPAWFAVEAGNAQVSSGTVTLAGVAQNPTGAALSCGTGTPRPVQSTSPSPSASATPEASPSATPDALPSASTSTPATPSNKPPPPPPPPPDNAPTLSWVRQPASTIYQLPVSGPGCTGSTRPLEVSVVDDHDPVGSLVVKVHWSGVGPPGSATISGGAGAVGPIPYGSGQGGTLSIWVTATDTKGHTSQINGTNMTVLVCHI